MGRHSKVEPPPAPRRAVEESTTLTGTHRAIDGESRRGIAKWPIAVLAVLALLGTGATAMIWGINSLNTAAEAEAQGCSEGKRTLHVAVAPKLKEPMSAIATRWNSLDRPVHSHCITVEIGASSWQDVLRVLGKSDAVKAVPAAWIAESTHASERLAKSDPQRVATVAKPLRSTAGDRYSYIVVGGDGVDEVQQRAAQKFRDFLDESEQIATLKDAGFSG